MLGSAPFLAVFFPSWIRVLGQRPIGVLEYGPKRVVEEDKGGQGACWLSAAQTLSCPTHGLQKREEGDYVFILENKDAYTWLVWGQ